ncbi:MAG TPA: 5'-methylthioadenosine/adenosylhomocysteine nucleosidase [Trueperaceae bacterium]|nr:5'-methylthioadenosine/adenosylhomocysteine nucleosidase [Trueperaceae bacterium]
MPTYYDLDPVAVIGAMTEEVERLTAGLAGPRRLEAGPFRVTRGDLEGVDVVVAECGIGKVNAAALTQHLMSLGVGSVVFTGVAGALDPDLRVGDVVIGVDAVQHDVNVTGLGYAPGEVPGTGTVFACDARLVALAQEAAGDLEGVRVVTGRVASGDLFVADPAAGARIRETFGAACAEMEGAACAQVCAFWRVPFVVVRSISDTADHSAHVDFRSFTGLAAARAETLVRGILRRLAARG